MCEADFADDVSAIDRFSARVLDNAPLDWTYLRVPLFHMLVAAGPSRLIFEGGIEGGAPEMLTPVTLNNNDDLAQNADGVSFRLISRRGDTAPLVYDEQVDGEIAADVAAIGLNATEYTFNNSGGPIESGLPYTWTFVVGQSPE